MKIPIQALKILDSLYGTTIVKKNQFYSQFQYWSRDRIDDYVNNTLKETLQNAYRNVPYYRELFNKYSINIETSYPADEMKLIPVLTKKIIRNNYQKLLSIKPISYYENGSSGSTGEHANFRITKNMKSWFIAGQLLSYSWGGFYLGYPYIVSGSPHSRSFKKKVKDRITRCYYIPAFSISNSDIQNIIDTIRKKNIIYIISFSSTLVVIADYLLEKNITLHPITIFSHGETMKDSWRKKIKSGFGNYPIDGWGTSGEELLLASQCEARGLYHLFEANCFLDYRNVHGNVVEPYITTFTNSVMPLINYKVGDLIEITDNECPCGRTLKIIKRIIGRDTDVITTKSGKKIVVHLFTGLFQYASGIKYFQIIQNKIDEIEIFIVKKDNFKKEELDYIINKINDASGNELKINISFTKKIPREESGKRRILKSSIPYFNVA